MLPRLKVGNQKFLRSELVKFSKSVKTQSKKNFWLKQVEKYDQKHSQQTA